MYEDHFTRKLYKLIQQGKVYEAISSLHKKYRRSPSLRRFLASHTPLQELNELLANSETPALSPDLVDARTRKLLLDFVDQSRKEELSHNGYPRFLYFAIVGILTLLLLLWLGNQFFEKKEGSIPIETQSKDSIQNSVAFDTNQTKKTEPAELRPAMEELLPSRKKENKQKHSISGQVVDQNGKGIPGVTIQSEYGGKTLSKEAGLFSLELPTTHAPYPSQIRLYYFKADQQDNQYVRLGQTNIFLTLDQ